MSGSPNTWTQRCLQRERTEWATDCTAVLKPIFLLNKDPLSLSVNDQTCDVSHSCVTGCANILSAKETKKWGVKCKFRVVGRHCWTSWILESLLLFCNLVWPFCFLNTGLRFFENILALHTLGGRHEKVTIPWFFKSFWTMPVLFQLLCGLKKNPVCCMQTQFLWSEEGMRWDDLFIRCFLPLHISCCYRAWSWSLDIHNHLAEVAELIILRWGCKLAFVQWGSELVDRCAVLCCALVMCAWLVIFFIVGKSQSNCITLSLNKQQVWLNLSLVWASFSSCYAKFTSRLLKPAGLCCSITMASYFHLCLWYNRLLQSCLGTDQTLWFSHSLHCEDGKSMLNNVKYWMIQSVNTCDVWKLHPCSACSPNQSPLERVFTVTCSSLAEFCWETFTWGHDRSQPRLS